MRETDFAGAGSASAAHQSAGYRLDASDVEGFAERQPRQDRRQRVGQQRHAKGDKTEQRQRTGTTTLNRGRRKMPTFS